jgi:alkylglycerol monooxygenase
VQDAWRTRNWKDKFRIWFKPTGWRPADLEEKFPVYKISDVYNFEKYETRASFAFSTWCWIQLIAILLSISYLFGNIALINSLDSSYIFWYGAFVFISVFALTELMDGSRSAIFWETIRCAAGLSLLWWQNDWFGISNYLPVLVTIIVSYFIISMVVTGWFWWNREERKRTAKELM